MMDVGEVNGRPKVLRHAFGSRDRLDRQLRKIDRNQNVSDRQLFHRIKIKGNAPSGSASLAEVAAFFV